jgi:phage-related protein
MDLALGNYLDFSTPSGGKVYHFQNFYINKTATYNGNVYSFLPFGFSGVTVNRAGDNVEATLVFPNNEISRAWGLNAVQDLWVATVLVMILDPDNANNPSLMHRYVGQVSNGNWDETSLQLRLDTVLDAVGTDVPMRRLTQQLVGAIPVSNNVRLR